MDERDTFSPTPWTLEGNTIVDSTGIDVAAILGFASQDERRANAILILAAADLLNVCRDLVEIADIKEVLLMSNTQIAEAASKRDAAIARARAITELVDNNGYGISPMNDLFRDFIVYKAIEKYHQLWHAADEDMRYHIREKLWEELRHGKK